MKRLQILTSMLVFAAVFAIGSPVNAWGPVTGSANDPNETTITDDNWDIKSVGVSLTDTSMTLDVAVYGTLPHIDSTNAADWATDDASTGHALIVDLGEDLTKAVAIYRNKVEIGGAHGETCADSSITTTYPDTHSIRVVVPQSCLRYTGKVNATAALVIADTLEGDAAVANDDNADTTLTSVNAAHTGGYYLVATDGGVFNYGASTTFHGSMGGKPLNKPMVGIAAKSGGYWTVATDGGIFAFGSTTFHGSMGGKPLNKPMVGMAATPTGNGYWTVASDGGIFAFGDAVFHGSMGGKPLNKPIVGMAVTPSGNGYWLVASDGGIFAFGDAVFHGSMGGKPLNKPIVGLTPSSSGNGYRLVATDGGTFAFGDAPFLGSGVDAPWADFTDVPGATAKKSGMPIALANGGASGYYLVTTGAEVMNFGTTALDHGDYFRAAMALPNKPIVGAVAAP